MATDGSEASRAMLGCLDGLRKVGSKEAALVHVFHIRDVGGFYTSLQKLMLPELEKQEEILRGFGFKVDLLTPLGIPYYEINRIARERSASMIVVGSLGASLINEILLGSTAHSILQNTVLPTLLIRIEIIEENGGLKCRVACDNLFKHILFPTDFSDNAEHALFYLEHVVKETNAGVTLLHVQDQSKIGKHLEERLEEFNRIDLERLEGIRSRLKEFGVSTVNIEIPYGLPTRVILEKARSSAYSLILMGSQGRGFIHEVFMGSVANNIARYAPLPVLFIPAPR
ncbi:MAG: universal stress protein [Spirochaetota bacterium]